MLKRIVAGGLFLSFFLCAIAVRAEGLPLIHWDVMPLDSTMTFRQNSNGPTLPVLSYKVDAVFDPMALPTSTVTIYMDLTPAFYAPGLYAQNNVVKDINAAGAMGSLEWAGPGTAIFSTKSMTRQPDGSFIATGELGINGINQPLNLPLRVAIDSYFDLPKMTMQGSFSFNPRTFGGVTLDVPGDLDKVTVDFNFSMIPGA